MELALQRYWLFGVVCLAYAGGVLWMLLRRRLTLQSSLLFLLLLLAIGAGSLVLTFAPGFTELLGFSLPSNFFFTVSIGALSFLHLIALTTISRLELRSLTLVQEVALIQEELERNEVAVQELRAKLNGVPSGAPPAAGPSRLPPPGSPKTHG